MSDTSITDAVPRETPGSQEIGFSIPDRYNASAILFDNLGAGRDDRIAVTGPAHLRRACGGCGTFRCRTASARPAAGRSRAAVPRRHAGLPGGAVRGDPGRFRAVAD